VTMAGSPVLTRLARLPAADRTRILAGLSPAERAKLDELVAASTPDKWAKWVRDPVGFVESGLGETVWSRQAQILESVRDHKRTAVPAAHAPGKSHIAARAVAWFGSVHPAGTVQIVTTASTFRQVKAILWPHIRRVIGRHGLPGAGTVNQVEWSRDGEVVAFGFSAADNDETAVQGIHATNVLIVVDEAGGISHTLGRAFEALMTGGNSRLLVIGNPPTDDEDSWFQKCCESELYNVIPIPVDVTPNWTGEDAGVCGSCPPAVPAHPVASHLVDQEWVADVISEFGADSPFVQARVWARFVEQVTNKVIPFAWVEQASNNEDPDAGVAIRLGVDVASDGGDEFVIARADGWSVKVVHRSSGAENQNSLDVSGAVLRAIEVAEADREAGGIPEPVRVKIDAIGVGWAVVSQLERWGEEGKHGATIVGVNVGEKARDGDKFSNQRAELWWTGRRLLQPDGDGRQVVRLDLERRSLAQLAGPLYKTDSAGRIAIERKAEMGRRGVPSPDRAEAVLLALFEPPVRVVDAELPVSVTQPNAWSMP